MEEIGALKIVVRRIRKGSIFTQVVNSSTLSKKGKSRCQTLRVVKEVVFVKNVRKMRENLCLFKLGLL